MWYWPWTSQNIPVNLSAMGTRTFAARPIISDSSREPAELLTEFILRSSTDLQRRPRSPGGSSPSHLPAEQESAIAVNDPASSSLARCGSRGFKFQPFADSIAIRAPEFYSILLTHSMLAAIAVLTASCWCANDDSSSPRAG